MKKLLAAFLCFSAGLAPGFAGAASNREEQIMLPEIPASHPRLFVNSETGFRPLQEARKSAAGEALAARVVHDARVLLKEKPAERIMEGRRLLTVSRNVLYRVNTLAAAFRLTGEKAFAERAALEMCAAADFTDWNPAHFLDVAEMTLALAVGYDWLYETLDEARRVKIRDAILEKGLRPSFRGRQWWVTGKNNWNQVCHAGMVAGALAVADSEPALARKVMVRAIRNLPRSMKASFSPNGAYPEGPMYWGYGTEFTVALLALLEGAFGQDFGLAEIPGFSVTGDFVIAATAPSSAVSAAVCAACAACALACVSSTAVPTCVTLSAASDADAAASAAAAWAWPTYCSTAAWANPFICAPVIFCASPWFSATHKESSSTVVAAGRDPIFLSAIIVYPPGFGNDGICCAVNAA